MRPPKRQIGNLNKKDTVSGPGTEKSAEVREGVFDIPEREDRKHDVPSVQSPRVSGGPNPSPLSEPPMNMEQEDHKPDVPSAPESPVFVDLTQSPAPKPPMIMGATRRVSTGSEGDLQTNVLEQFTTTRTSVKEQGCDDESTTHHSETLGIIDRRELPQRDHTRGYDRISQPEGRRSWPFSTDLLLPQSIGDDSASVTERSSRGQSLPPVTPESLLPSLRPAATVAETAGLRRRKPPNPEAECRIRIDDVLPSQSPTAVLVPDQVTSLEPFPVSPYALTRSNMARMVTAVGTAHRQCPNLPRWGIALLRKFIRYVHQISTLLAYMVKALLAIFMFLLAVWAVGTIINCIDYVAMICCEWGWARSSCRSLCGKAPWLVAYMLSSTCTSSVPQGTFAPGSSYMEPNVKIILGVENIAPFLLDGQSQCMEFQDNFPVFRNLIPIAESVKDELRDNADGLCSFLLRSAETIPGHFQYVNIFVMTILRDAATAEKWIDNAMTITDARGLSWEQTMIQQRAESFVKRWIKEYQFLADPGKALAAEITGYRHKNNNIHRVAKNVLTEAKEARVALIKKWPLTVRLGRWFWLLRSVPSELSDYNEAIEVLKKWVDNTRRGGPIDAVLKYIQHNVTTVNVDLRGLATTKLTADFQFNMGADGLQEALEWVQDVKTHVRGLGDGGNEATPVKKIEKTKQ
ncbi:MAG: hypothetical protein Q9226_008851 [Calogaya cf. arnoldii]